MERRCRSISRCRSTPAASIAGSPCSRRRRDNCPAKAADRFIERARRIAESLGIGNPGSNGAFLAKGDRYRMSGAAEAPRPKGPSSMG